MCLFRRPRPPVTLVIPARFNASRFPGKPLVPLRGSDGAPRPLIEWTWEAAQRMTGIDRVLVATDDRGVADAVAVIGGEVVMTSADCRNGTERCAEAMRRAGIGEGVVVNLQGDAPLMPPAAVDALLRTLAADPEIAVASPMLRCPPAMVARLLHDGRRGTPGNVTVVVNRRGDALYFSRRVLPWFAGDPGQLPIFRHLGVYAYRAEALACYAEAEPSNAERLEGLEQLRFLDVGIPIRMVEIDEPAGGLWEVNYPEDVPLVEAGLRLRGSR